MENKINEVAANQETQNQRGQRDLELRSQELAAKNAALEEELLLRQQSQEEKQIAQSLLLSQPAESAIDVDIAVMLTTLLILAFIQPRHSCTPATDTDTGIRVNSTGPWPRAC